MAQQFEEQYAGESLLCVLEKLGWIIGERGAIVKKVAATRTHVKCLCYGKIGVGTNGVSIYFLWSLALLSYAVGQSLWYNRRCVSSFCRDNFCFVRGFLQ
jgi:hypothetical protein